MLLFKANYIEMAFPKMCCVPGCSNTWNTTKDAVAYYRFPNNEEIKQKWLEAINWTNGKPRRKHCVCAAHFEAKDLANIDENTTIVPSIFTSEFVVIKQETDSCESNLLTSPEPLLNGESVKNEIDDNEKEDDDFEVYEIVDTPTASDNEIDMPMPKRIKIENNFLNLTPTLSEGLIQDVNIFNNTKQLLREQILPKITKVDLSKVSLKVISIPSDNGTKIIVKAVTKPSKDQSKPTCGPQTVVEPLSKSSEEQLKSTYGDKPLTKTVAKPSEYQTKPTYGARTVVKVVAESSEELLKPTTFTTNKQLLTTESHEWDDNETREFLNYMLINKPEFINLPKRKHFSFWGKMEVTLKEKDVIKQPITADKLYNKWKALTSAYKRLSAYELDTNKFPFMNEVNEILRDSVKVNKPSINIRLLSSCQAFNSTSPNHSTSNDLKSYNTEDIVEQDNAREGFSFGSEKETDSSKSRNRHSLINVKRYQWLEEDTRAFLKYIANRKLEFVSLTNRTKINFWRKMAHVLRMHSVLKQTVTAKQLSFKWKVLMRTYKNFPFDDFNQNNFRFIGEMKEILLDSLKPHHHSISIGLASKSCYFNDKIEFNNTSIWSTEELKNIYIEKKIEGRELKNKLLRRLINDSNSHIIKNGFRVVQIHQPNKLNKSDVHN